MKFCSSGPQLLYYSYCNNEGLLSKYTRKKEGIAGEKKGFIKKPADPSFCLCLFSQLLISGKRWTGNSKLILRTRFHGILFFNDTWMTKYFRNTSVFSWEWLFFKVIWIVQLPWLKPEELGKTLKNQKTCASDMKSLGLREGKQGFITGLYSSSAPFLSGEIIRFSFNSTIICILGI